jgi:hypothetical protein
VRNLLNQLSAGLSLRRGASGFFATRPVMPWLQPAGTIETTSFYDISEPAQTRSGICLGVSASTTACVLASGFLVDGYRVGHYTSGDYITEAYAAMPLPNFLIVGAPKCGTTSLYQYLQQHPDVHMSLLKEPRYFPCFGVSPEERVVHNRAEYKQLFDGAKTERAIGEASPNYLHAPEAAERIAAELPDAKIIVSLRNPADRAYSSYLSRVRRSVEKRPVEDALQPGNYFFDASLYSDALARYFAIFDRSRVKVLLFDDFSRDTAAVLRDLCAFLDIAPNVAIDTHARHNVGFMPKWPR